MPSATALLATPALLAFLLLAGHARAHLFLEPYDLPLPLTHYLVGAGAVVLLSFLAVTVLARRPAAARRLVLPLPGGLINRLAPAVRALSLLTLLVLLATGMFGEQGTGDASLLPVFVWVVWWVGLAFVCALLADVWPLIDPWRSVGLAAAAVSRRLLGPRAPLLRWPERAGSWPATLLFLAFAWVLLVWPSNAVPARLAGVVLSYSVLTWTGMALLGVRTWVRFFDPFAHYFGLFGRFAPVAFERDARRRPQLVLRPHGAGLLGERAPTWSLTAFILVMLAVLGFDGYSETPPWWRFTGAAVVWLYDAGVVQRLGYVAAQSLVKTAGLLAFPLMFAAVWLATCALCARLGGAATGMIARSHALSLVPIAIGVHLGHDFALLAAQGQSLAPLAADPFGLGWSAGGTPGPPPDEAGVNMGLVWALAVTGGVGGHAVAVWLAHRAALALSLPVRARWPLAALMVAYTVGSLWVLSLPIVR